MPRRKKEYPHHVSYNLCGVTVRCDLKDDPRMAPANEALQQAIASAIRTWHAAWESLPEQSP